MNLSWNEPVLFKLLLHLFQRDAARVVSAVKHLVLFATPTLICKARWPTVTYTRSDRKNLMNPDYLFCHLPGLMYDPYVKIFKMYRRYL